MGVPTSFTEDLVGQMITGLFSEVRLHLKNIKAHAEDDVKAKVLFTQKIGHFVLDVDMKEIRAVLRPGKPELQFGGDKIDIRLPVRVAGGPRQRQRPIPMGRQGPRGSGVRRPGRESRTCPATWPPPPTPWRATSCSRPKATRSWPSPGSARS